MSGWPPASGSGRGRCRRADAAIARRGIEQADDLGAGALVAHEAAPIRRITIRSYFGA